MRQVEKIVKELQEESVATEKKKAVAAHKKLSLEMRALEEQLKGRFGTKVNIRQKGSGGKIEIQYYSDEDLNRILDAMGGNFY